MSNIPEDHPIRKMSPENAKVFMTQLNEISGKRKKEMEHKLHIQHRNTRHDAIDIINNYVMEIEKHNDQVRKECQIPPIWDPGGGLIRMADFDDWKYQNNKKSLDANEITRRIMNMKQRKPKDGE